MNNPRSQIVVIVPNYRHKLILEKLKACRSALTADLSAEFGVSKITIRRDLDALAERGFLLRSHGGATWRCDAKGDCFLIRRQFRE